MLDGYIEERKKNKELARQLAQSQARVEELEAVVEKLPKKLKECKTIVSRVCKGQMNGTDELGDVNRILNKLINSHALSTQAAAAQAKETE